MKGLSAAIIIGQLAGLGILGGVELPVRELNVHKPVAPPQPVPVQIVIDDPFNKRDRAEAKRKRKAAKRLGV